jgi:membrane dipeptidase
MRLPIPMIGANPERCMEAIFDGHNDVLLRLWFNKIAGGDPVAEMVNGTTAGHIDLPRAKAGGLAGGLCAIYIPNAKPLTLNPPDAKGQYANSLSTPLERLPSLDTALGMAEIALRLERAGVWKLCRSTADIRTSIDQGIFAAVMHMEGCEAIGADLSGLHLFYAAGLRTLGPVWSRHNIFGFGVPFAYPAHPDTGPGLTDAGIALVKECNRLGVMIDLSHITEQGFWDVVKHSDQPPVASHSNAHALTPVARNLTDKQLDAIGERKGLAGLNFAVTMLRSDGRELGETPLDKMVRHIDHMVERAGIDCVAIGSDFDGAMVPKQIGDAAGLQNLVAALRSAGYGDAELAKICRENWLRVLGSAWHES